jgi:hypothetical protein
MRQRKFYKEFLSSLNEYKSFFKSEKGQEIFSNSNYLDGDLKFICLYDSFDNSGIRNLVKNITLLDKEKFHSNKTYYKYSRKGQYLKFQNMSSSHGIFADIQVLNNNYIKEINMSWCQRSNYTAIIEFQIVFKDVFKNFESEYNFIVDVLENVNKRTIYYFKNFDFKDSTYVDRPFKYIEHHNELFKFAVQKYIEDVFYNKIKKNYDLMTMYVFFVKDLELDKLKPPYMGLLGKHKSKKTIFYIDSTPSVFHPIFDIELITAEKYFDHRSIMTYFSNYRNILYYNLYFSQELNVLNNKISGYNLEAKKIYNFKNLMWMYRKIAELESSRDSGDSIDVEELNKDLNDNWKIVYGTYEGDEQISIPYNYEFSRKEIEIVLQKYKEQYNLYKVALESQTNRFNTKIAFISLGLSILSILVAIAFGLIW